MTPKIILLRDQSRHTENIFVLLMLAMPHTPRLRINRPSTRRLARAGNLCLFTAANVDFIDIFLI